MENILMNRLSKFIEEVRTLSHQARNLCNNLNDDNLESAKVVSAKLKSILSRFTSDLYNYFNICKNPDADEISNFTTYQLEGEEVLAELDTILKSKYEQPSTSIRETGPLAYSKLPELNLPQFSGNLLEWHQFWDQFNSNINRRTLNDVDKLLYLKSSLNGDAARLVDGFDTTNKSYKLAVDTLKARYGKENEIIHAHHRALSNVKRAERMEDCRITLDEIERHLRVLQSMGENTQTNQMRYLIMEKFPSELIYETKMRLGPSEKETVASLLTQLSLIVSTKEEARRITQQNNENTEPQYTTETLHVKDLTKQATSSKDFDNTNFRRQRETFQPKVNTSSFRKRNRHPKINFQQDRKQDNTNLAKRKKWHCIFCNGNHFNTDCPNVKAIGERKVKLRNRCYICFQRGHNKFQCKQKTKCQHCGEYGMHNKALCPNKINRKAKVEVENVSTNTMFVNKKDSTVLQTAVVNVQGNNNTSKPCRILLDTGSGRSYITQALAKNLNLQEVEHNNLAIFTFGSHTPKEILSPLVKINIMTRNNIMKTFFANVVSTISQGVPYPKRELLNWKNVERYPLADDGSLSDRVDILLGNDYYYTIMSTNKICIEKDLYLVESEFGWILSGKLPQTKLVEQLSVLTYFQSSCEIGLNQPDPPLDSGCLKRLWDLESIGITDSPKANRDEEAIKHFNDTTKYKDNRYYVSWPWNDSPTNLPSNFGLAFGRLVNLLKRLDSDTLMSYSETLNEQLNKGIIEEVPSGKVDHAIHYIPHHAVSAPGKSLRIVYDASAKTKQSKSLNEHLHCGPLLLEDLTGLLIKFRCHAIGLTADVEKAFLQIGLNEQDRDVTRFLWLKDIEKPAVESNLVHFRFTRVPFGLISSPFILNATVKHHLSRSENQCVRNSANDIYVDNLVTGTNNVEEALDLYKKLKTTFNKISMNLRQWSSNSKSFMKRIPDTCPDKIVKLLGLNWNLDDDTLSLRAKINENNNFTKRGILKTIAAIYDPCGFSVPILLQAKILLQDLWKSKKVKWDTALDKETTERWRSILNDLKNIENLNVPRRFVDIHMDNAELHCFTDSSMQAYAAVVYLVQGNTVNFVIGKSRLVPIKDQEDLKIPRLELLGVLIGNRLLKFVLKFLQLDVTQQTLWTDSQIVIDWYNSDKLLTPFVSKRLEEIKQNKELVVRHVPTEVNPADVGTRPTTEEDVRSKWLLGPEFLKRKKEYWPVGPSRTVSLLSREGLLNAECPEDNTKCPEDTTKADEVLGEQLPQSQEELPEEMRLSDSTLKEIKKIQLEHFTDEVNGRVTSLSRNLGLFKDIDGILRCKGRLKYAEWSFDKRYPVIIPKDCDFTNKLIMETHEKNYHVGVNHTLSIIRQKYWIPQGKNKVLKILKKCFRCLKHGGGPFKLPPTPALPHERVNYSKPFTFTGIDYLGPVLVKTETGSSKRWICLFTCLAVRAVHLEVVEDLSAEEGLLALRRMISTRGVSTLITSDNASHFKLIADIVANSYCVENKIKWRFIPELAPWHGGFYERLIGIVKHCLRRSLQKHLLTDSQLLTMMKEIEAVINTRPLTCVDTELLHILKPSDFLQPGRCFTLETTDNNSSLQGTSTKTNLIMGWKRTQKILDEFKEMFHNRYLPSLRERYSHSHKQPRVTSKLSPEEGQIVQIKGDKNREGWKVGKIVSVIKGSDGLIRVARVKVGDSVFTRSIAHLYPLEIEDDDRQNPMHQATRERFEIERIPKLGLEASESLPHVITTSDNAQEGAFDNNEMGNETEVKMTDSTVNETNKESVEIESANKVQNDLKDSSDIVMDNDSVKDKDTVEDQFQEIRHKRIAAVRALEKIKEWTQNLMTTLF